MTIRKLDKKEWRPFLDGVSRVLQGERAEIEVLALKQRTHQHGDRGRGRRAPDRETQRSADVARAGVIGRGAHAQAPVVLRTLQTGSLDAQRNAGSLAMIAL
jgi:hypothetical protein